MVLERLTMEEAEALLTLPRQLGVDPADGMPIVANNGRYGPYVQKDRDYRNLEHEEQLFTITLDEALRIFAQPKVFRRGNQNVAAKGPLREFGTDPVSGDRSWPRTAGSASTSPTVRRTRRSGAATAIEEMTPGAGLRAARRPPRGGRRQGRDGDEAGTRKSPAKKAPAKKPAAKKPAVKKAAAKKTAAGER